MLKNKFLIFFVSLLFPLCSAFSQNVELKVKLDSTHILIGDQLCLHLSLTTTPERNLAIQNSEKWKMQNCEVVSAKSINTDVKRNQKTYTQEVIVTSFDTGVAVIAPILVFEGDTVPVGMSHEILFYIDSLPVFVDTTLPFKDIKLPCDGQDVDIDQPEKAQHNWGKIICLILLILAFIGAAVFVLVKYLIPYIQKRRAEQLKAMLKENAGTVAIRNLKELKQKKLWQKGQVKDYYSELSMILRTYMDHQWAVNAKEMVTDEIMEAIEDLDIEDELRSELHGFLQVSDLVKFAKEQPAEESHEKSMKNAYHFVRVTDQKEHEKAAAQAGQSKKN